MDFSKLLGGKSQQTEDIENQIKVLATNIEVLNQKLITDPNAAITPGESLIKRQLEENIKQGEDLAKHIKNSQAELSEKLIGNAQHLEASFKQIHDTLKKIPEEKSALSGEIRRLGDIVNSISSLNKKWLVQLFDKMEVLNRNTEILNKSIYNFYKSVVDDIGRQVNTISEEASSRIFKSMLWFIISIIALTLVFNMIFNFIILKIMT